VGLKCQRRRLGTFGGMRSHRRVPDTVLYFLGKWEHVGKLEGSARWAERELEH
jgi:hypothetical protein